MLLAVLKRELLFDSREYPKLDIIIGFRPAPDAGSPPSNRAPSSPRLMPRASPCRSDLEAGGFELE